MGIKVTKAITKQQGVGTVEKQHKDGSIESQEEVVSETTSEKATASINVSIGLTKNLGNYESVKITVGITLPCEPTEEDIEATYASGKAWVDDKVNEINAEIEEGLA